MKKFHGLGVAMVTPFKADGKIDYDGLKKLTGYLISNGVDYLVVQGTTGESPVLDKDEKRKVLDAVLEVNNGDLPVVFGIGGNNTKLVTETIKSFDSTGVDGILSASPYYNKPTQAGIYAHYKAISESTDLPVIIYNVPGRTSSNIEANTTLRLAADFKNMVAVKEASGNMDQIMTIIRDCPEDFAVISGDDPLTLPLIASGANGVISVLGNCMPADFSKMVHHAMNNEMVDARALHYKLLEITRLLFKEGNPAGVKEVLQYLGICERHLRLPLVPVSPALSAQIEHEMKERAWI